MSFFRKNRDRMIVTGVTIILIIIIGVTSSERTSLTRFESTVGNILSPINKVFYSIGNKFSNIFATMGNLTNLIDENKELREKIAKLEEENRNYENIIGKSDYLKNESKLMKKTKYNLIPAHVVGKEPGNWYDKFTIDKGLNDGIKKGATVIQGVEVEQNVFQEGIIGRITDVGDNWAKVATLVDEVSSVSFKTIRTQDGGIISGSVDGEISGYLFDSKTDVIKGDKLYTSGLGGVYIKDLYIGEVSEVIKLDEDLMKRIKVNPASNFKKIYKVYIIAE